MLSKNSPAMVVAVLVDKDEGDVPSSKDATIDKGPAEESRFWISIWWDASRGCIIPDTDCRRVAFLFVSLLDINNWDAVKDVLIGGGSTGASKVWGKPVSDISKSAKINLYSS